MISATQLGLVPPEIKRHQNDLSEITRKTRAAWSPTQREYKSEDVRRIATALNRSISHLIDAMSNADDDPVVSDRDDLIDQLTEDIAELQKFQRSLAPFVDQSRDKDTVVIPEFRTAIPAMMDRVLAFWQDANPIHDLFLSWINGNQAEDIAQGYQDILDTVQAMPGSKAPPGFFRRHRGKIALGVAVVAAGGAGTLWLLRRRSSVLQDAELLPAAEPQAIPVGVHIFRATPEEQAPSSLVKVSEMVKHVAGYDGRRDGDQL